MINLIILLIITFLLNLPFGYWRGGEKKFSWQWFVAIHLPVVLLYFLRSFLDIHYNWITLPILLTVFFLGQWSGQKLRDRSKKKASSDKKS